MSDMFDQFDSAIDTKELAAGVAELQANQGEYEEPPVGTYEVKLSYMTLGASKAGNPMAKVTFVIMDEGGELNGRRIYMNQVLTNSMQIHFFNEFLRSLKTSIPVTFTSYRDFNRTMIDIKAECDERKLTFKLNFAQAKNPKYRTYTIEQVFENAPAPASAPTERHFEQTEEADDIPF